MTEKKKIPIIAIIGPTAVGKTKFSLALAERLDAEVISVDSRQVYRYLDVGTDKVSLEIRRRIPHHLIDVVDPDQIFSAADFALLAADAIERIRKRGKTPLLIGGTPFYYKAICGSLSEDLPKDEEVRRVLEYEIEEKGLAEPPSEQVRAPQVLRPKVLYKRQYRQRHLLCLKKLELYSLSFLKDSNQACHSNCQR